MPVLLTHAGGMEGRGVFLGCTAEAAPASPPWPGAPQPGPESAEGPARPWPGKRYCCIVCTVSRVRKEKLALF